jgi:hypothetical protein
MTEAMAAKVFISYRRDDTKYQARMIHSAFCKALPSDHVFMDVRSIPPGANFRKILKEGVNQCEVLLALIGPGWIDAHDPKTKRRRLDNQSDFVRIEIGEALARGIPVVPVLLDDASIPDKGSLPDELKELVDRQAEFVNFRTFETDVDRLIKGLGLIQDVGHIVQQPIQPESPRRPPIKISSDRGKVCFDYSTNNGVVTVGEADCLFQIAFSGSSKKDIQLMSRGRTRRSNLRKIARVRAVPPGNTLRFDKYDSTSDLYRIGIGETFLAENEHGYFIQGKIVDVRKETHGSDRDEVTFQYQININGSAEFISL